MFENLNFGEETGELQGIFSDLINDKNIPRKSRLVMKQIKTLSAIDYYRNYLNLGEFPNVMNNLLSLMMSYNGESRREITTSIQGFSETWQKLPVAQAMGENRAKNE